MMKLTDWLTLAVAVVGTLMIPALALLVRVIVKSTRTTDQLNNLGDNIKTLVESKDKIHAEMLEQMRHDRESFDRRLRFMEEFWMRRGIGIPDDRK